MDVGNLVDPSDARIKDILGPVDDALALLTQLNVIRWRHNQAWADFRKHDDTRERIGFEAQHTRTVLPSSVLVRTRMPLKKADGQTETIDVLAIDSRDIYALAVRGVQQLVQQMNELRQDLADLREHKCDCPSLNRN